MDLRRFSSPGSFQQYRALCLFVAGILLFAGCSTPSASTKAEAPVAAKVPPKLAITVKVGSMDLFNLGRRIEKKDVERLNAIIKREQVEILSVQGITRYPNVKTRIDFVAELAALADMRQVFGETIDMTGRQLGNAVFSMYPIRSNQKKEFDVTSAFFESALAVAVDAGVRDVLVVSTRLPEKATAQDVAACIRTIAGLRASAETPLIVSGNLPSQKKGPDAAMFSDTQHAMSADAAKQVASRMWFAEGDLFKLLNARTVKTELGVMTIAEFGLFQPVLSR